MRLPCSIRQATDVTFPDGFDLDALLAPIPGKAPQGADMREDYSSQSPYNRLRDARSVARDAERQAESHDPDNDDRPADPVPFWRTLRDISLDVLTSKTKDLEIAAWLTEALVRSHGLSGLAAGSRLIAGLAERYWDVVYPLPDEYGLETRVAPISGLNGRGGGGSLTAPIFGLVLFTLSDGRRLRLYEYQASAKLAGTARQQRDDNVIPFADVEKDARSTAGQAALARLRDEAAAALVAWEDMSAVLDEKAGADAPSTSHVRDLVREISDIATRYAPGVAVAGQYALGAAVAAHSEGPAADAVRAADDKAFNGLAGVAERVVSREEALRSLERIAEFFRKTEPHSPLSYTLDEAVRRARLPWLDLLEEVIADRGSRDALLISLGIRPPPVPD
jgi:type VI secretion system protein ImpA